MLESHGEDGMTEENNLQNKHVVVMKDTIEKDLKPLKKKRKRSLYLIAFIALEKLPYQLLEAFVLMCKNFIMIIGKHEPGRMQIIFSFHNTPPFY